MIYNPYQNMYSNYQTMQMQNPSIAGKVVNDFNQIIPSDVPMDGSNATFLKSDLSEIQVRAWNGNGQIQTISYKPVLSDNMSQASNIANVKENTLESALNELTALFNERLDKLEKLVKPTRAKKEVSDE